MKKAILLVTGVIIAGLALVTPFQDQTDPMINHGFHQRISVRIANGELVRTNAIQLDSITHITTLIIGRQGKLNNFHNTI